MPRFIKDPLIQVKEASDTIIVCNWFERDDLEGVIGKKISESRYQEFREWLLDSSMQDECSEMVREFYDVFEEEVE